MCLKNLNKNLLEQIKDLKDENIKIQNTEKKFDKSETEEILQLKNHNQSLLPQIKKLKDDNKSLKNKLEELITKEVSKSSVQVEERGKNMDPINITTQEDERPIEVKTYSEVAVQTVAIPSRDSKANSTTTILEVNQ